MTDQLSTSDMKSNINEAVIRKKKSFSIVWFVPIVALLIGGWLVYKAISEKGPVITISFESAEGLEAGKTKIKYKDVEVGVVESITLNKNLASVIVTAELKKGATPYLTDQTRFWVVRARLSAGEVSGLGTLFGGAYIGVDPSEAGTPLRTFKGLEMPPVVTTSAPGRHFILNAKNLGSLDRGSPVFYRRIMVGQVESYELAGDGKSVNIRIFIDEPHQQYVRMNTRFWNAGGIDLSLDANGLRVDTQSLVSIMSGGVAFDNLWDSENDTIADNDVTFQLSDNYDNALKERYVVKRFWALEFGGSVRGLSIDAPVEFRGLEVGRVLAIDLQVGNIHSDPLISVLIETEPERFMGKDMLQSDEKYRKFVDSLVARGLRAQLITGNMLTGQLFVDLDFHPEEPLKSIEWEGKHPKLPTVPAALEELFAVFEKMLNKIEDIPFDQIGKDISSVVKNFNETVKVSEALLKQVNAEIAPEISMTLKQTTKTLAVIEKSYGSDSSLNQNASRAMEELASAAQSLRLLADYLQRHPDALIYGKGAKE